MPSCSHVRVISNKGVNTVPKAVLVWPALRYILDTDQYRCTVSGLSLLYIYIYVCVCVCMYMYVCVYIIINIKVYHKTFHQFRTNYSWFQTLVTIKRKKKKTHNIKNRKLKSYRLVLPEISRYGRYGRYLNRYEMLIFQYRYIYWYDTYQPV